MASFGFSGNRITTHSYDLAGNTINDGTGKTFTYDAENKQTLVNNGSTGQYWYDGDGKRVKKYVPTTGETTVFVYDAAAKLVAEYSTSTPDNKVAYLTNDHLGSPRINTDQNGNITSRHDYRPFGEEILRTGYNYAADSVRKQFTGYEMDNETGLGFAQARYFFTNHGRSLTVDRYFPVSSDFDKHVGTEFDNIRILQFFVQPQYLNRYTYTINNPLKYIDVDGNHPGLPALVAAAALAIAQKAAVGAAIGAVVGAGIEAGRQMYSEGRITDGNAVINSAGAGAIYGAFIGAAGPVGAAIARPLASRVVLGAIGANAAGSGIRYISGERTTSGDVITDTLAGAVSGGVGYGVSRIPILPARVYLPNNPITRGATRVSITKVTFDGQRNIWWSPSNDFGDTVIGNAVRSGLKSGIGSKKSMDKKDDKAHTEVVGYELFLNP